MERVIGSVGESTDRSHVVPIHGCSQGDKVCKLDSPCDLKPVVELIQGCRRKNHTSHVARRELSNYLFHRIFNQSAGTGWAIGSNVIPNGCGEYLSRHPRHTHRRPFERGSIFRVNCRIVSRSIRKCNLIVVSTNGVIDLGSRCVSIRESVSIDHLIDERIESFHLESSLRHCLTPSVIVCKESVIHSELVSRGTSISESFDIVDIYDRALTKCRLSERLGFVLRVHELNNPIHRLIRNGLIENRVEHILRGDRTRFYADLERVCGKHGSTSHGNITGCKPELLMLADKSTPHTGEEGTTGRVDSNDSNFTYFGREVVGFRHSNKDQVYHLRL
nr:MAG: capsid protein [Smacoviridae sp.]